MDGPRWNLHLYVGHPGTVSRSSILNDLDFVAGKPAASSGVLVHIYVYSRRSNILVNTYELDPCLSRDIQATVCLASWASLNPDEEDSLIPPEEEGGGGGEKKKRCSSLGPIISEGNAWSMKLVVVRYGEIICFLTRSM